MKTTLPIKLLILVIILSSYPALSSFDIKTIIELTKEDHLVENLSALFYLLAGIISSTIYLKKVRNIYFLLFAIFFLICFGEEISWGQRIFNIETPEALKLKNIQGEINIHNLSILNNNGNNATIIGRIISVLTSANGLYSMIWISYAILLPIGFKYISFIKKFINKLKFPVFSIWFDSFYAVNFSIYKVYESCSIYSKNTTPIVELKETNIAFLYCVGFLLFYLNERSRNAHCPPS